MVRTPLPRFQAPTAAGTNDLETDTHTASARRAREAVRRAFEGVSAPQNNMMAPAAVIAPHVVQPMTWWTAPTVWSVP